MLKTPAALILIAFSAAAQSIPKKYDPETLRYMQSVIDAIRSENAAFRAEVAKLSADVREIKANSQRTMQVVQKVNATALSLKALEGRVDGLDITIDSTRITRLEDKFTADINERARRAAEAKADREATMAWLKYIGGGIGSLIGGGITYMVHGYISSRRRNRRVDGALAETKRVVDEVKVQTNGNLDKLKAERDAALAELAILKKS